MPYNNPGEVLTDIANSIRTLHGSTSSIPFVEMPELVKGAIREPIDLSGYNGTNWIIPCAEHFDFSSADNISGLFRNVDYDTTTPPHSLTIKNLLVPASGLSDSHCDNVFMSSRFDNLNLINWTFPLCSIDYMFEFATINSLDLTGWDTSQVTSMYNMFNAATVTKMWVPSTFVATAVTDAFRKPFSAGNLVIYTDATDAETQGWGTGAIGPNVVIHYNSTYQDFINA